MFGYHETSTAAPNPSHSFIPSAKSALPSIHRGNVSLAAERQHVSLIIYAVPAERVRALLPASFEAEETSFRGRAMAWVSVESFFDPNGVAHSSFEQTNYRLHAVRDGEPCLWLLGVSLGSLAAVGARNLWLMPWRLSAMEFRAAYSQSEGRYRAYSLQAQSQWANANWQIEDSGDWITPQTIEQLPASLRSSKAADYFPRRDNPSGREGCQRTRMLNPLFTRGWLKFGQCDLLERLGLLDSDEIKRPRLVALQHHLSCQIGAPSAAGPAAKTMLLRAA